MRRRVALAVDEVEGREDEARSLFAMSRDSMIGAIRAMNDGDAGRVRECINDACRNSETAARIGERFEVAMRQAAHFEQQAERVRLELEGAGDQRRELATAEEIQIPAAAHVAFVVEEGGAFLRISQGGSGKMPAVSGGNPRRVTFVAALVGPSDLTARVREIFKAEHVAGEWFAVSERLAAFVLEVRYGEDVGWLLTGNSNG